MFSTTFSKLNQIYLKREDSLRYIFYIGLCFTTISSAQSNVLNSWRGSSNPRIMSSSFERNFEKLPLNGDLTGTQKLWASDYWPSNKGIINYRWNSKNPSGFNIASPNKDHALKMEQDEIATLAPSEKLDLLNGNYNYPLKKEVGKKSSPNFPDWFGICNGWAPATINHNEPLPKTLVNPDGIHVPFGSSDIKGLISYYYAYKHRVATTHQMGKRCSRFFNRNCETDLNAGAFHIVLANKVGLEKSSFIVDVDKGLEVWNQAVNKFNSRIVDFNLPPGNDSAPGTIRRVHVVTVMSFVLESKRNSWEPVLGTDDQEYGAVNYEYTLELDASGRIVGGEWISHFRPDFMWSMEKVTMFEGMFVRLPELLND